jgi:O-antigen ligase
LTATGVWLIRVGLVGYAVTAPFSLTASTILLLMALAGAVPHWLAGEELPIDATVGWAVIIYIAVKLITGLCAYDPLKGTQEFFHLWPWLLFWVIPFSKRTGPSRSTLHRCLAVSVAVVAAYAVCQNLTGFEIWRHSNLPNVLGRYPALAFFDNQQTWAGFALAVALYMGALAIESSPERWLYALSSVFAIAGAVASQIRGTLIGLLAGIAVWLTCARKGMRLALAALVVSAVALALSPGTLIRFNELKDRSLNPQIDISRPYIWKTAWEIGARRPLLGAGPGNFQDAYEATKDRPEARTLGHAHNEWMNEWATSGAPGVLAFSWLIFAVGRALWRRRHTGALPALTAWVALAAGAVFQCHFSDETVVMAAVFLAAIGLRSEPETADTTGRGMPT